MSELPNGVDMYFNQNFEDYLEELYHNTIPEVMERKITFEDPEIAKRVAELDKKFGLTYYHEKKPADYGQIWLDLNY